MNFFVKRIVLFLFPIIVILAFPFMSFYISGEFIPTKDIIAMQLSDIPVRIGKLLPFWQGNYSKIDVIKRKKPAVITLGNSRVLQFREAFFVNNDFFNGGGIGNLKGFQDTIEQLKDDEKPEVIIIGMDQSYFHPYSDQNNVPDFAFHDTNADTLTSIIAAWRTVYKNIITGTYPITSFFSRTDDDIRPIGLQAYVQGSGQRNDGSYAYGLTPGIHDPRSGDYEFQDTLKRIQKGRNLFYKGDTISEHALSVLADFLAYCKQRNIHVVGFLPPYAQEIYDMLKESGEYGYMFALDGRLTSIFDRYGGSFFDFSNMESFGGKKNEIVDGLHASEKAYLRLFMNMAEEDSVLQLYAKDSAGLSDLLNTL